MENLAMALKDYRGFWFGLVSDNKGALLMSTFSDSKKIVEKRIESYNRTGLKLGSSTVSSSAFLEDMIKIYDGQETSHQVSLDPAKISGFQKKVYDVLEKVPRGRVTSYGLIARKIDSGPRAVGTAVASNPWCLFVPCHRVIPADLSVGNYSMGGRLSQHGTNVKRKLLQREGVAFEDDRIGSSALWTPSEA